MISIFNNFRNDRLRKKSMIKLGEHIENYVNELESSMIIPEELMDREKEIYKGIKVTRKLIKKLKEGDKSVFNEDMD